ncbi:MAG: hypothetical protein AAB727_02430 [Patescibacteria group bacterium]
MDTQKDISKGHGATPQKSQEIRVYKGHSQNDVIKDNTELSFIISKTEKLTTAVYFLTDFLDVREPLKWELREKAVHFMLLIGTIFNKNSMTRDVSYSPIHKGLNDIVSLLDFLSRLALISEMNTSILKREYTLLCRSVESRLLRGDPVGNLLLPKHFFDNERLPRGEKQARRQGRGLGSGPNSLEKPKENKENAGNQGETIPSGTDGAVAPVIEGGASAGSEEIAGYNPRHEAIVGLLRTKGHADIKDIAGAMPQCGEKTVQRELATLVSRGIIKKIGEKRWSKYTLV